MDAARIIGPGILRNVRQTSTEEVNCIQPADVFWARCEARALLYTAGEFTLHESVDPLQAAADASGLVHEIGQDAVQALMAKAFSKARADG